MSSKSAHASGRSTPTSGRGPSFHLAPPGLTSSRQDSPSVPQDGGHPPLEEAAPREKIGALTATNQSSTKACLPVVVSDALLAWPSASNPQFPRAPRTSPVHTRKQGHPADTFSKTKKENFPSSRGEIPFPGPSPFQVSAPHSQTKEGKRQVHR